MTNLKDEQLMLDAAAVVVDLLWSWAAPHSGGARRTSFSVSKKYHSTMPHSGAIGIVTTSYIVEPLGDVQTTESMGKVIVQAHFSSRRSTPPGTHMSTGGTPWRSTYGNILDIS